jgi:hypothetical protein
VQSASLKLRKVIQEDIMQGFIRRLLLSGMVATLPTGAYAQSCLSYDSAGDFMGWADYPHCLIDQHTQSTVRWLDDWFSQPPANPASELTTETALAQARLRLINEWVLDDRGELTPALRLRASVALPQLARRLSLVFEDENGQARRVDGVPAVNEAALAVRWAVLSLKRLNIDTDVGLHSATDLFVRARMRQSFALAEQDELKLFHSARYGIEDGWRGLQNIEWSHALSGRHVAVIYHQFDYEQDKADDGMGWSRGMLLAEERSKIITVSYGFSQAGRTRPSWSPQTDSLWWRWRQQVAREWFFIEVEPRLTHSHVGNEDTQPSLTLRFEVLWGGSAAAPKLSRPTSFLEPEIGMSLTP